MLQTQTDFIHLAVDIISPLAILLASWVGMKIKTALGQIELSHQKAMAALKADLVAHNAEVASDLRAHQIEDAGQFREIRASLERIEHKR